MTPPEGDPRALIERGPAAVAAQELAALPEPARRFLDWAGVPRRPRDASFALSWRGRFRRGPAEPWRACEARQWNGTRPIARIFRMKVHFGAFGTVHVRDTYLDGRGRMRGRLYGLLTVVDATGPELDVGELTTWLNDAVMFAPGLLLEAPVTWSSLDADTFRIELADAGRTVSARVELDRDGAPRTFVTTDRFVESVDRRGGRWQRAEWTTPIARWQGDGDRRWPAAGEARWRLPAGEFAYAAIDACARPEYGAARATAFDS